MDIDRLLTRTLWMEALYDAFPCRFTLWLWARAGNKLRAARDGSIVSVGKVKWPGTGAFVDSLTGSAKPYRRHDEALRFLPGQWRRVPNDTDFQALAMQQSLLQSGLGLQASHAHQSGLNQLAGYGGNWMGY